MVKRVTSEKTKKKISRTKKRLFAEGKIARINKGSFKKGHVPWIKGKTKDNCWQLKVISEKMKENNPMKNPLYRAKAIKLAHTKEMMQLRAEKMRKGGGLKARKGNKSRVNKPEKLMIQLIKENNLPFNYVGDGKIWFRGENHSFNPDFLSKNPKHIIELFGDYWHRNTKKDDNERLTTYRKYGYKTLVIWTSELKNTNQVLERIKKFTGEK